jgi:hypothetical protein
LGIAGGLFGKWGVLGEKHAGGRSPTVPPGVRLLCIIGLPVLGYLLALIERADLLIKRSQLLSQAKSNAVKRK